MAHITECAVCGKEIEVTQKDYELYTEPLCSEHKNEKVIDNA